MLCSFEQVNDLYSFDSIIRLQWRRGHEGYYLAFKHYDQWSTPPFLPKGYDILSREFRSHLYEMIALHRRRDKDAI